MGNLLLDSDTSKDALKVPQDSPFGPLDAKLSEYVARVDCLAGKIYFHQQQKTPKNGLYGPTKTALF